MHVDISFRTRLFLSVFIASAVSLLTEILLTRIFSVTLWYHFAFFVVSLVMFGLAFGGAFVYFAKGFLVKKDQRKLIHALLTLFSLSYLPLLFVPELNIYLLLDATTSLKLLEIFMLSQLPFFFLGTLMSYLFMIYKEQSGELYFYDLLGAGIGALTFVFLIDALGAIPALVFLGILSCVPALLVSDKKRIALSICIIVLFAGLLFSGVVSDLREAKDKRMDNIFQRWNSLSMVRVFGQDSLVDESRFLWATSPSFKGQYPQGLGLDIDAEGYTPIIRFDGNFSKVEVLRYYLPSFVYYLTDKPRVLVIGPGGGRDILSALTFGSEKVIGVEVNPIIANDVMRGKFANYSGNLYLRPGVDIVVDDARSYIRNSPEKYNIITASMVDTSAATTAGAYSLTENNLYTVEAISEYVNHLSDNGFLSISRWNGSESLKLTAIYIKAAEKLDVKDPENHIAVIGYGSGANIIYKKTGFNESDKQRLISSAEDLKFVVYYYPGIQTENEYVSMITSNDLDGYIRAQKTYLSPSTDDSPFFFNSKRIDDVSGILGGKVIDVGLFLLYCLFIIAIVLTIVLIIAPFLLTDFLKRNLRYKIPYLTYFSLLGVSFMLVEISFIQKFILFLGHPVYSATVIISSFLISAGIGSHLTGRTKPEKLKKHLKIAFAITLLVIILYNILLYPLFLALIGQDIVLRILISAILLTVLGLFMGMLFPLGIRLTGAKNAELIPMCWAVNGAFSVIGSISAVILSMNMGFTNTLFVAAGTYLIAYLVTMTKKF